MVYKNDLYIHLISGDIATLEDWRSDYESMEVESWHGKPVDDCDPKDWIVDGKLVLFEGVDDESE